MMQFTDEILSIGGREYTGSIFVETEVTNASFDFEQGDIHGTEHALSIQHYPECFVANGVSGALAESIDAHAGPALEAWLASNLRRVEKRFEMEVKQGV